MKEAKTNRRGFIKAIATSAAVYPAFSRKVFSLGDAAYGGHPVMSRAPAQAHCFLATELVLKAQKQAQKLNLKV
jgi:hypothetical protein